MFTLTAIAYIGITIEILFKILVLGVVVSVIRLLNAKALELRSEVKRLEYYFNRNKEEQ